MVPEPILSHEVVWKEVCRTWTSKNGKNAHFRYQQITQDTKTVCEVFTKMFKGTTLESDIVVSIVLTRFFSLAYPHRPCLGYKIEKESGKTVTVDDYVEGSQEELFANIHKYDYKWLTFQQIETRVKHIGSGTFLIISISGLMVICCAYLVSK